MVNVAIKILKSNGRVGASRVNKKEHILRLNEGITTCGYFKNGLLPLCQFVLLFSVPDTM